MQNYSEYREACRQIEIDLEGLTVKSARIYISDTNDRVGISELALVDQAGRVLVIENDPDNHADMRIFTGGKDSPETHASWQEARK